MERGYAGGKITMLKPQETLTENRLRETLGSSRKAAGKENTRVTGAGIPSTCRKPEIPQPPGMKKMTAVDPRRLPKGKISTSSDFSRFRVLEKFHLKEPVFCSDPKGRNLKSVNCSTESENRKISGLDLKEIVGNDVRVLKDYNEQVFLVKDSEENGGKCNLEGFCEKDASSALNAVENCKMDLHFHGMGEKALDGIRVSRNCMESAYFDSNFQGSCENAAKDGRNEENSVDTVHTDSNYTGRGEASSNGFGVSGELKEKDARQENEGGLVVNKYPSKIQEKIAYLEGEVKKIALDINDTDALEMILLDIQDKVFGIEKAIGHAGVDSKGKLGSDAIVETDELRIKHSENNSDALAGSLENSVESVNHEELEARLSRYHNILGSKASFGSSAGKDQSLEPNVLEVFGDKVKEEGSLNPIDENQIALDFLALLDNKHPKIKNKHGQLEYAAIQEMDADRAVTPEIGEVSKETVRGIDNEDASLTVEEILEFFDEQENRSLMAVEEDAEDPNASVVREVRCKPCTAGWFAEECEFVLLAHDDSTCSYHDITHSEEKSEYKPPAGVSHNLWGDCWLTRVALPGGVGKYVVAASAGNTLHSGFCSWDFYTKDVKAFRLEDDTLSTDVAPGNQQWWYKPSEHLIASTASCQKVVSIYDIRDGDLVVNWELRKPVETMDCSSPLQWRLNDQVVIAEAGCVSLWEVESSVELPVHAIYTNHEKISALYMTWGEAEFFGSVRQRQTTLDSDGVVCIQSSVNVLDFRSSCGLALSIAKPGVTCHSIYSDRDYVFLGCTDARSAGREHSRSLVLEFSIRKRELVCTYHLPESNSHFDHSIITQVWANSKSVMAVCGLGLFVFDRFSAELHPLSVGDGSESELREVIGPNDLYRPTFDYYDSRVLLISRDRPARWQNYYS